MVRCPRCQFENRAGRRFCSECGAPLSAVCPSCGAANEPGDKFCGACGAALAESASGSPASPPAAAPPQPGPRQPADQAERRQVTILFADLSGFTELSSRHDPEEMHRLLSRFFAAIDRVVEDFGGTIDKHIGDAVMAVFGAPVAHGNDPERAVRAALAMHEAMKELSRGAGIELRIHVGIASGQVVASGLGSASHTEYTVTGTSVNLAARLAELASPGQTLISDAAYRAVSPLVRVEPIGDVSVKGLDRPITIRRILSLAADGGHQAETPFVGRRAELRQLTGVLETLRETGSGQAIYVRGEAGIGKSRLVEELRRIAGERGFACHTGLVLDFGVGRGQDAIRGVVRSLLVLPPGSDEARRAEAAEQAVAEGLLGDDQLLFVFDLLDVPQSAPMRATYDAMDNETRNRGKQEAVVTLAKRLSRRRPLLIAIEDLHWADPVTLGHVARLCAAAAEAPLLLVMTSRIEGDPLDRTWRHGAGRTPFVTIDLGPLREEEALALASGFVDATNRFALSCIKRSEGNPLFLEQLLRSATAGEAEDVPGSVQSIVLSRVDRLSPDDRRALHAAAVLGQRFSLDVLRFLIDEPAYGCGELVGHHLVRPTGPDDYLFSHALIWESVYASVLRDRRRELHQRAAEWFSDRDPVLHAEHLDRAGDPRAARAYLEAARMQAGLFHFDRALRLTERGLAAAAADGERYDLLMLRGECLRDMGRPADSIAVYRGALDVAARDADRCRAWIGLAAGMRVTDEFDEALACLDRAEAVGRAEGLELELSQVHYYRGNLYFPLGNIEGCLEQHQRALDHARRAGSPEGEARALSGLGDAYYAQGRMITALGYFRRCIELCRAHGFGRIEVGNLYMVAWNRLYINEIDGSLADALAAVESAARVGHRRAEMVARLTAGRVLVDRGELDAAEAHVRRGLELAESLGANRFKPFLMIFLARIRFARRGHHRDTVELMREAFGISEQTGITFLGPWVLSTLALVSNDRDASGAALARGEEILKGGCVGHNYFAFYRNAMEVALRERAWDEVERYAAALADYTRPEPLPRCDYVIARARALAAHGRAPTAATAAEIRRLKAEAERIGLLAPVAAMERALAAAA